MSAPDRWLGGRRQTVPVADGVLLPRRWLGPPLLLGVFFLSLYLLTMGGHLDSPDEELMFLVTRGIAERGAMDIGGSVSYEALALAGVDGHVYAPYGPVSSAMSVPFYEVGRGLAALLPPRYSEVTLRFAVGLRGPIVSAAACVLLYAVASELGFGTIVAILLTLAFGMATLVWPYAKFSWSEPVTGFWLLLAVFAAMRAVRVVQSRVVLARSALASIAVGLAIGSKITTAVAVPALLIYLVVAGGGSPKTRIVRVSPFVLMLMLPVLGLASLNVMRFGNPLETGYRVDLLIGSLDPRGIAGLLVSPSKSLFLYAPAALLGLVGFPRFAARLPWEAGLFGWLFVSHVVAYGVLVIWHGDAAWGPRYLVPIVPFIVLPAGAALAWTHGSVRRGFWGSFAVLVGVGMFVNLGGVLVDQRVSFVYLSTATGGLGPTDAERWDPEMSPVLIHWSEFGKRVSGLAAWWSQPISLVSGTYASEPVDPVDAAATPSSDLFPRWTAGSAVFELRNHGRPAEFTLEYLDNRPSSLGEAVVQVIVDGIPLPEADISRARAVAPLPDQRLPWILHATLDNRVVGHDSARIEIRSQTWQPAYDAPPSRDIRELGIQIWDLQFRSDGQDLVMGQAPVSPMPVTDARPWGFELETWFYTPPHVADIWEWFLYLSDLPHWLMLIALVPLAGLAWSGTHLWRRLGNP